MSLTFQTAKAGYANLWAAMDIRPEKDALITRDAQRILANKERYQAVEKKTGVPWFLIGCIHDLEGGMNFATHLHNGDPLTHRTVHVPAGRPLFPATPPFEWEESAIDALKMRGLDKIIVWSIERMLFEAEAYNGWGYEARHVNSPYDWAGTDNYDRGKFVSDGVFSATAVSQQLGVAPLLFKISALDPSVHLNSEVNVKSVTQTVSQSHGLRWLIVATLSAIGNSYHAAVGHVANLASGLDFSDVHQSVTQTISTGQEVAGWFGVEAQELTGALVFVGIALAFYHFYQQHRMQ